ncbi:MAG: adenylate/guanylate cyclase domain-containing protein [Actinomycetota bacterium]|nr:adenylate/guanylate cyclase domain-containing protein [Actinomycetota bacterium]
MAGQLSSPSGTVTFLFTDIEGSSRLWEDQPAEMQVALERHDELLRSAIEDRGGYVFTTAGDSFAAAFSTAGDAVGAAVAIQELIGWESWPESVVLRVRVGLHAGEAQEREGDYFGQVVNTAARVMSAGHGGQILVSDVVRGLAGESPLIELGTAQLRGVPAMRLWQVVTPGLQSVFPPLKAVMDRSDTLPRLGSTTVGRDQELAEISSGLTSGNVVTLTGVGGVAGRPVWRSRPVGGG